MKKDKFITNFALDPDENTIKQFKECISNSFVVKASLMPDAHSGYVAPIGSVIATKNYIVPSWVGFDIGCGVLGVKFELEDDKKDLFVLIEKNKDLIFEKVKKKVPLGLGEENSGYNLTRKTKKDFLKLLKNFKNKESYNKDDYNFISSNKALKNLGTLGSGNHFIELGFIKTINKSNNIKDKSKSNFNKNFKEKDIFLIIHTGSRSIGHKLATKYMKLASNKNENFEKTFSLDINSKIAKNYIDILEFCLEFAYLNRLEIAYKVHDILESILNERIRFSVWANKNHNLVSFDNNLIIHRKGATPSKKGELGIIPGNMRDGSYLVEGLGNKDFLESSSHGAGRVLSRKKSKEELNLEDFKNAMKDIKAEISEKFIDESPMAYKNIDLVMEKQKDSVKVLGIVKPIINWKG